MWLHRFAVFVACATLFLVVAGASVTSTGSGLAVPDWPLSFGQAFPPMKGGVFFEHGHRMVAGTVLVLTLVLTVWIFRREKRASVKRLSLAALSILVAQAVLGGLTVLFRLPTLISVSHAGLAQIFFCMIVAIALMTSPAWRVAGREESAAATVSLRRLSVLTTGVVYLQILIGAFMRHTGAGLAIPDFPLSYGHIFPPYMSMPILLNYAHRLGAFAVFLCVILVLVEVLRHHRRQPEFTQPGLLLAVLFAVQIALGALTIWTRRAVLPTTAHVAVAAAVLATSLVLALRAYHGEPAHTGATARAGRTAEGGTAHTGFGAVGELSGRGGAA